MAISRSSMPKELKPGLGRNWKRDPYAKSLESRLYRSKVRLYNFLEFITLLLYSLDSSNLAYGSRFQLRPRPGLSCFGIWDREIAISLLPHLFYIAFQEAHLHKSFHQRSELFFDSLLFHYRIRVSIPQSPLKVGSIRECIDQNPHY